MPRSLPSHLSHSSQCKKHLKSVAVTALLLFSGALLAHGKAVADSQNLRLHVLDVGEGQAVLLQQGNKGLLVDTGSMVTGSRVVNSTQASGVEHLKTIILTHLHPDHASGFFRVREAYPEALVLHNGHPGVLRSGLDSIRWVAEALQTDTNAEVFIAGDVFRFGDLKVRAIWPKHPLPDDLNESSLVLSVESSDGTPFVLLMGDAGISVEGQLLAEGALVNRYPILVAGHHGSLRTASQQFLSVVRPEHVAVSINANNMRGYPDPNTLKRLEAAGANVWLTYRDGTLCFTGFEQQQLVRCDE